MKTINLPKTSLDYQKIVSAEEMSITLTEESAIYVIDLIAEEPVSVEDLKLGTKEERNYIYAVAKKKDISCVELSLFLSPEYKKETWKITLSVTGMQDDIKLFFYSEHTAKDVMSEITQWLFDVENN